MAENLAYPLFLCAVLAMLRALERPSTSRQLTAVAVIVVASLARVELAVLLPAFVSTILVLEWREASPVRARLSQFRPTWIACAGGGVAAIAMAVLGAAGPHVALLGGIRPLRVPANVIWHLADLDVYSGVIPFAAFALLAYTAFRSKERTDRATFVLLATCTTAWLIVLAATYESGIKLYGVYSTHVFDRYVFYVVPLFLIALLSWVEDGLRRPRRPAMAIAAAAALLPLALPLGSLLHGREWGTCTCTVGLLPLVWLKAFVGEGLALRAVLVLLTAGLAVAFLRTVKGGSLVRATIGVLLLFSLIANVSNTVLSQRDRDAGVTDMAWVDDAIDPSSTVAIVWRGDRAHPPAHRLALRQTEFFNRSVGPVYDLRHPLAGGIPSTAVQIRDGLVVHSGRAIRAEYLLAHGSLGVRGRPVARDPRSGLVLYRLDGPVRVVEAQP